MIFYKELEGEVPGEALVGADVTLSAPEPGPDRCLWLPKALLDAWELPLGGVVELAYGRRAAEALIGVAGGFNGGPGGSFVIPSASLAEELCLVTGLEYRIVRTGPASIALGPVIGLIVPNGRQRGSTSNPDWERLMEAYDEVKGLTILFGPDDVDWAAGFVNGRHYAPGHDLGPWIPGRFPIPAAAHRRAPLSIENEAKWLQGEERRLFNGRFSVDRWEIYQAAARHDDLAPHLARTALATSFQEVREALERSHEVWLKPRLLAEGGQGRGVVRLALARRGYEAIYRSQDRIVRRRFPALRELRAFLSRQGVTGSRYVVQEPVPSATIGGRGFEVRLLIQRGGSGEFCCPGRFAKLGAPGSVDSDPEQGAILLPVDLALTAALRVSLEEAREVERRAVSWCFDLVARLEEDFEALGDVGVDIVIGPGREIWLIQCDFCPDYSIFEGFDAGMHRAASTMWHRYASFLASFPVPAKKGGAPRIARGEPIQGAPAMASAGARPGEGAAKPD